jgi:hypothetical protein
MEDKTVEVADHLQCVSESLVHNNLTYRFRILKELQSIEAWRQAMQACVQALIHDVYELRTELRILVHDMRSAPVSYCSHPITGQQELPLYDEGRLKL